MQDTPKEPLVVMRLPIHDDAGAVIGAIGFALFDELRSLSPMLKRYLSMQEELASTRSLLRARQTKYNFAHFIGTSAASLEVKRRARRSASTDSPVLLLGETGTGKSCWPRRSTALRRGRTRRSSASTARRSPKRSWKFFGTAPGAFTGADRKARAGKLQIAQGGRCFSTRSATCPAAAKQTAAGVAGKGIRTGGLQRRDPERCAGDRRDVHRSGSGDQARRVSRRPVLPPQRAAHSGSAAARPPRRPARRSAKRSEELRSQHELNGEALGLLGQHAWPGNIRELRNVLERAALLSDDLLTVGYPRGHRDLYPVERMAPLPVEPLEHETFSAAGQRFDRQLIETTLAQCGARWLRRRRGWGWGGRRCTRRCWRWALQSLHKETLILIEDHREQARSHRFTGSIAKRNQL
jgi:hypothetical protein